MSLKNLLIKIALHIHILVFGKKKDAEIKTVALISNTAIGDTLMATPAFRALKLAKKDIKIIAVLNPSNAPLFKTNPYIDEIVLYNGKWRNFYKSVIKLRELNVDVVLTLHSNEPEATPLGLFSKAHTIVKIPNDKNPFAIFHSNQKTSSPPNRHGVFDRMDQLKFIGVESDEIRMELFLSDDAKAKAQNFLSYNNFDGYTLVGFQLGASTKSRMWFEEKWIELANALLISNKRIKIVLTGAANEKEIAQKVADSLPQDRVLNAAGALNIEAAAALICRLNVFVTPDTGPMHIAIALGIPTVALFAVADPIKSGAVYDKEIHIEIKKPRTCDPCVSKLCKYQKCMLQIEADEVKNCVFRILNA